MKLGATISEIAHIFKEIQAAWYLNDSQRRQAVRNEPSLQHLASHPEHPFSLDGRGIGTADGKAAGVRAGDQTGGSSEAHEPVSVARDPAQAVRFRNRSTAERVNSNLKDNYGGRFVRVRGAAKVMPHLMFGLIAITATQLFRLLE